jgi:hypothetical protein
LAGLFSALGPTEFSKHDNNNIEKTTSGAQVQAQSFVAETNGDDDDDTEADTKIDLADVKDQDSSNAYEENLA